ncbi:MAG: hypothetical protein Q8907_07630 [Bacteroidota bacterium]|nr:hypothetical protein [Bacteroidota bacterium]MDP4225478.1 hypothetical protein [Bacteroidota bacterium]MDP4274133.1 hypothetical protein [Bacteroidota bacterium]
MERTIKIFTFMMIAGLIVAGCTHPADPAESAKKYPKTLSNIKELINKTTEAKNEFVAYSGSADQTNFNGIAKLFSAASKSEGIGLASLKEIYENLGFTPDSIQTGFEVENNAANLKIGLKYQSYMLEKLPAFIADAKKEGEQNAETLFTRMLNTEKKYQDLFKKAMADSTKDSPNLVKGYQVCSKCGSLTDAANAPKKCSVCGASKRKFISL